MLRSALCTFNATCAFKACTRLFSLLIPCSFGLDLPVKKTFATIANADICAGVYATPVSSKALIHDNPYARIIRFISYGKGDKAIRHETILSPLGRQDADESLDSDAR